ncbi:MAG: hypothetical protein HC827_15385 [Cyanobacteria bacterium RM1_2_2]|nr:hypothetical protein [Cyanobacteria bacterium RM1_2_2]
MLDDKMLDKVLLNRNDAKAHLNALKRLNSAIHDEVAFDPPTLPLLFANLDTALAPDRSRF